MKAMLKPIGVLIGLCLVLAVGSTAIAQTKTIEIKNGEVLAVEGNRLLVRGPEGVKAYVVPEDMRFDMDGKSMTVRDLEPGMRLAAIITTVETPIQMTATEVREGEVVHTIGNTIVVRNQEGKLRKFTSKQMEAMGLVIYRDGKQVLPNRLRKGDKVSATIVTKLPPETISETQLRVLVSQPPPPKVAQARPAPAPPEPMPVALPKTGSSLPLVGLAGLALLALGLGLTVVRRVFLG